MQDDDSLGLRGTVVCLAMILAITLGVVALDRLIQTVMPDWTSWWMMAFIDGAIGSSIAFELGRWSRRAVL